ncbi:MAG: hypothetical protein MUP58_00865 [Candidatus Nanohaloarchaeota archaeon QJJ-9]|nr:hypothetical protein [Candidatus Nanohaloarchaeota archaeon QJJ-9]
MDIERSDIVAFGLIAILVALAVGISLESQPDKPGYCKEWAKGVESNLSQQYESVKCTCKPATDYKDRIDAPEQVKNVSNLFLLDCEIDDQQIIFPIWQVNDTRMNMTGNETARINQTG